MVERFEPSGELTPIHLRRITTEDADGILDIDKGMPPSKMYLVSGTKEEVEEEIENNNCYLIEVDGKPAGYVQYELKAPNHAYISGLVIRPEFNGMGIGRQAMESILEELKDVEKVDLVVHPENKRAIDLYIKLGFKQEGKPKEDFFGDGEPRIEMVLEK